MRGEVCENCGQLIEKSEKACVFKEKVVCAKCDEKLRTVMKVSTSEDTISGDEVDEFKPESRWLGWREASKTGIIVAVIIFVIGISQSINRTKYAPDTMLISTPYGTFPREVVMNAEKHKMFEKIFCWSIASLCLIVRSFRPKLSFWRGFWTILGGMMLAAVFSFFIVIIQAGGGVRISTILGSLIAVLIFIAGAIMFLIYGFEPKRDSSSARAKGMDK